MSASKSSHNRVNKVLPFAPSPLCAAALDYAQFGIPVFPCRPGGKEPATPNGHHDATTDPGQVIAWWSEKPDYNIGLYLAGAGLAAIDIDGDDGESNLAMLEIEHGALPKTYTVRTPRGGRHLYFKGSLRSTIGKLAKRVDTRGVGGYVLAPPSVVDGKPYRAASELIPDDLPALPTWIPARCKTHAKLEAPADVPLDTKVDILRAEHYLKALPPVSEAQSGGTGGADAHTYKAAAMLCELGISDDLAFTMLCDPALFKIEPRDHRFDDFIARKVINAYKYKQNDAGASAYRGAAETFKDVKLQPDARPAEPQPKRSRYYPIGTDEMDNLPPVKWLVQDLLMEARMVLIVGQTQSYKSFVALDIALAVATGLKTFGVTPKATGPVFYCALEGLYDIMGDHRRAWCLARGVPSDIPDFYALPAPPITSDAECKEFIDQIRLRCEGRPDRQKPRVIVLETLNRMLDGLDENASASAAIIIKFCSDLVALFGCTVIVVHHQSDKPGADLVRGSSALRANFDTLIEVSADRGEDRYGAGAQAQRRSRA